MTLHEAMVEVLRAHGGGCMYRDDIAREIARRDLFRRPSDGAHPPSDQIRLRARKPEHQHLLECSDVACTRIGLRAAAKPGGSASPPNRAGQASASREIAPKSPPRAAPKDGAGTAWYDRLRDEYRPKRLALLLVGESPPDPGAGARRFFYAPELTHDNLYRGVAQALYGERPDIEVTNKPATLTRMRDDGLWLIDAAEQPINKRTAATRKRSIRDGVPGLVRRCRELDPRVGVIVCHGVVYAEAAATLRAAGVVVLHDEPLPFPLGNWRAQFIEGFRRTLAATLPDQLQDQLRAALSGDDTGTWVVEPIRALDGRTVAELILAEDQDGLERFVGD